MAVVGAFEETHLEGICKVLGHTTSGLTGAEIGRLLVQIGVDDGEPRATKWKHLFYALENRQRTEGCGNIVVRFIYASMDPERYTSDPHLFELRRDGLNHVLIFSGYSLEKEWQAAKKRGCKFAR